jgi:hypothetical protein
MHVLGACTLLRFPAFMVQHAATHCVTQYKSGGHVLCMLCRLAARTARRLHSDVEENVINPGGGVFPPVPPSPYVEVEKVCPNRNGVVVEVNNYVSSPYVLKPFAVEYKEPEEAKPMLKDICNATAGACMDAYYIEIKEGRKSFKEAVPACANRPHRVLTYNGSTPGNL